MNIKSDLDRYVPSNKLSKKVSVCLFSHSFHLVVIYRMGKYLSKLPFLGGFIRIMFEYFIRIFFSSDISLKSEIGPGLVILHGHDIVIGSGVRIGSNCKIMNGVTFGNKDTEVSYNQQPTIGDNVVIGTGAKILGSISIGNNVRVGANSVVITNIPDDVVAVGVPARICSRS